MEVNLLIEYHLQELGQFLHYFVLLIKMQFPVLIDLVQLLLPLKENY